MLVGGEKGGGGWALTHFGCYNNQDDHVTENIMTLALSTHTDNCSNLPVSKKKNH